MPVTSPSSPSARAVCARCSTELAPTALICPACRSLVHSERLRTLAATADSLEQADDLIGARSAWQEALVLLPADSQQHQAISARIAGLTTRISALPVSQRGNDHANASRWKRVAAIAITAVAIAASKLKFLLLGLTKASTFFSMFAFFGVYWSVFGWPLALGLVVSIYIHEMGHVSVLKRLGIGAGAPLFIPGIGALVMLKERISDPKIDARIGLAGPVWGLGAALASLAAFRLTGAPIWKAIAELTAVINLFNLIPVWQLDGARGFNALSRAERWLVLGVIAVAFALSGQKMLIIIGAVGAYRAFQRQAGPGDPRTVATFALLVAALAWMSHPIR
jgi:Zn-dependent protease